MRTYCRDILDHPSIYNKPCAIVIGLYHAVPAPTYSYYHWSSNKDFSRGWQPIIPFSNWDPQNHLNWFTLHFIQASMVFSISSGKIFFIFVAVYTDQGEPLDEQLGLKGFRNWKKFHHCVAALWRKATAWNHDFRWE